MKPVIAIDGPAASGKGTLARKLAEKLNYAHLDTGAIYRMVALYLSQKNEDFSEEGAINAAQFVQQNLHGKLMDHADLRLDKIGVLASQISAIPQVRNILLEAQQNFAKHPPEPYSGAVLDGRDIGTVVCPEANTKLYITADVEVRAKRRYGELHSRGLNVDYSDVLQEMKDRDFRDMNRGIAPLRPAADAVILDTSTLSPQEAFVKVVSIIENSKFKL